MRGARPSRPSDTIASLGRFWDKVAQCWDSDPQSRPSPRSLLTYLPLRRPVISADKLKRCPHQKWEVPSPGMAPASNSPSPAAEREYSCPSQITTLDSCILGILEIDSDSGKTWEDISKRLTILGCPSDVIDFTQGCWDSARNEEEDGESSTGSPSGVEATLARASSIRILADSLSCNGGHLEAIEAYHDAINLIRRLPRDLGPIDEEFAFACQKMGDCLWRVKEFNIAVRYGKEAVELRRLLAHKSPDKYSPDLATSLHDLAFYFGDLGKWDEAVQYGAEAVKVSTLR